MPGPVLLIDLWSGYSGAAIALLSLGVKCYVLAAESNPDVVKMADTTIDQMVYVPTVECVNAEMVRGLIQKRNIQTILVGGGSPCQGNTSLNKGRRGLADPRSQQPKELVRIRDELKKAFPNIAVLTFLENVASSFEEVKQEYDLLMGVKPVSINAGIFGSVGRSQAPLLGGGPSRRRHGVEQPSSPRERRRGVGERSVGHLRTTRGSPSPVTSGPATATPGTM